MDQRQDDNEAAAVDRRAFLMRMAAGVFAVPVIASFTMDSLARAGSGKPQNPWQSHPNMTYPNQGHGHGHPHHDFPNQWCFPNQTYPNQTYPNQTFPNQTFPNQTYPNMGHGHHDRLLRKLRRKLRQRMRRRRMRMKRRRLKRQNRRR